jgi:hypothetical protein
VRGGLAVDGGIERKNDFRHGCFVRARNQRFDREVLRTDTVERRQRSAEHMIAAVYRMCTLERPEISNIGDDDDDGSIALGIGADGAGILRVDIAADLAYFDFFHRRLERGGERSHQQFAFFYEMQRRAPRRTGT